MKLIKIYDWKNYLFENDQMDFDLAENAEKFYLPVFKINIKSAFFYVSKCDGFC